MNEIVKKWKSTGLLDEVPEGDDEILLAFCLNYISQKMLYVDEELDDNFLEISLPAIRRLYDINKNVILNIPAPIMWASLKETFNECEFITPEGYNASDMSKSNCKLLSKRTYKKLNKKYGKYIRGNT